MDKLEYIINVLNKYAPKITDEQASKLLRFNDMLIERNKVMNLTAITGFEDVVIRHFSDSVSISQIYDLSDESIRILDIGTGAGFPGIPLKIMYPGTDIVLLDSLAKRISFLDEVIDELDLNDTGSISAIHSRAEDFISGERETFDLVVSRAVAALNILSEYALPYVRTGGCFIAYKSEKAEEEINEAKKAISVLGGEIEEVYSFNLNDEMNRTFVKIRKISPTPEKYPRRAGIPLKKPIS